MSTARAATTANRYFVLADAGEVGHYRIWDRWTMRPVGMPAHKGLDASETEARRMNGAQR